MAESIFDKEYKTAINYILKDLYSNTEYWGKGPSGTYGIVKPITKDDDPEWSNYNFINTNWRVKDDIIIPYLTRFYGVNVNRNLSYRDNDNNAMFFKILLSHREEIFGPDSNLRNDIIKTINSTRKRGSIRENYTKLAIESIPGMRVETISSPGGVEDYMGTDLIITTKNGQSTAQVKPFSNLSKNDKTYVVHTNALKKDYTQDLMVFGKMDGQQYHVAIFRNEPKSFIIEEDKAIIPKSLIKVLINYNIISKTSKYRFF